MTLCLAAADANEFFSLARKLRKLEQKSKMTDDLIALVDLAQYSPTETTAAFEHLRRCIKQLSPLLDHDDTVKTASEFMELRKANIELQIKLAQSTGDTGAIPRLQAALATVDDFFSVGISDLDS